MVGDLHTLLLFLTCWFLFPCFPNFRPLIDSHSWFWLIPSFSQTLLKPHRTYFLLRDLCSFPHLANVTLYKRFLFVRSSCRIIKWCHQLSYAMLSIGNICCAPTSIFYSVHIFRIYHSKSHKCAKKCVSHYMLTNSNLGPHSRFNKTRCLIHHCASSWLWLKPRGSTTAVVMCIWGCVLFPAQPIMLHRGQFIDEASKRAQQ